MHETSRGKGGKAKGRNYYNYVHIFACMKHIKQTSSPIYLRTPAWN